MFRAIQRLGRRKRTARFAVEPLDRRLLLAAADPLAANVFAVLDGAVLGKGSTATIPVHVSPLDFDLSLKRSVTVGFHAEATAQGALSPLLTVRSASGKPLSLAPRSPTTAATKLYRLAPGDYTVAVTGRKATAGDFRVEAFLVGDADGNRSGGRTFRS